MKYKTKGIIVAASIIGVLIFSLIVHLRESRQDLDVLNLDPTIVDSIKIYNRGLSGKDSLAFVDRNKVEDMANMIVGSSRVNYNDINFRDSNGLCDIKLYLKGNEVFKITIHNNIKAGGILRSGDYCYRNDSLLKSISLLLQKE